uniref:Uncharacterized protein n=1 Tax=Nannospalax galili TaxID=1026970 RepID=A0A8C6Q9U7_NANGA
MAGQPQQQQMKTSFLFIQLQRPPAHASPAQSPATGASAAAPGGLEEGHIFPSPGTNFLANWALKCTQGLATSSSPLPGKGPKTQKPASFNCYSLKEKKGEEKPQVLDAGSGVCGSPHCRRCLAPASGKLDRPQLSCSLVSPAPAMNDRKSSLSMGWKRWPVISAPEDLWGMDTQARNVIECSLPQTTLPYTADRGKGPILRSIATDQQVLTKNCEEGIGTTVMAMRARLYRYCPIIQISQSCLAPADMPLKKLRFASSSEKRIKMW